MSFKKKTLRPMATLRSEYVLGLHIWSLNSRADGQIYVRVYDGPVQIRADYEYRRVTILSSRRNRV